MGSGILLLISSLWARGPWSIYTGTCLRVLVGWKEVLMPNGVRILLMTPEVFFTYIQDGHIGIWWGGALTKWRSLVGLLLYQLLEVTIFSEHQ